MAIDRVEGQLSPAAFSGHCICAEMCELGEGITYDPIADTAWWFDIKGKRLHEWRVASKEKRSYRTPFPGQRDRPHRRQKATRRRRLRPDDTERRTCRL